MISIELIRKDPEFVQKSLSLKDNSISLDSIIKLDKEHRMNLSKANELRSKRNKVSEKIANAKKTGENTDNQILSMRKVGEEIKSIELKVNELKESLNINLLSLPNLPNESVPEGKDENSNKVIREWGKDKKINFEIKSHLELGQKLNLFDFERGAKISGSGFPLYTGKGAKLERALINYMLDIQTNKHGYTEIFPPFLVKPSSPKTVGQLPKFSEDMYYSEKDDLWLIPTAEVPLTNIHSDEILSENQLPICYTAYSACFRREAGSYGKETRGFLRVHQFNKVELVQFVKPEKSYEGLELLTSHAEFILQSLNLKYRVVELCTGDLSFSASKCYDLELWAPGEQKWLEVSSCSNFEDFQARRGNIRFRKDSDNKVELVHTLNGSGLATPRLLVALLESYQNEDGSVSVPDALQPYFGSEVID
ncbi:MAG: serine--tRNA ligase [Candidatus Marinimicrobia bacterium]|jgi:seryl-tRNA synthetase|nr:serine--tRNA ligase [Candidatus Neomarinimicrobiota bacterium]MBT4318731.1 serine--tRNA ligase [Candidatus Neomarinimicrobiota bacterium]MBT5440374.1 serine--tRNA ligase [Candidatus Neomarinimicrobiota bacterium]|tara:strand:- start:334 stop:1602 length:1269 start_codon:yes stop_codon:yes gene_type:complete